MSQTTGIVCLFSGHSSYLMQYKKTSVLNVKVTMQRTVGLSPFSACRLTWADLWASLTPPPSKSLRMKAMSDSRFRMKLRV